MSVVDILVVVCGFGVLLGRVRVGLGCVTLFDCGYDVHFRSVLCGCLLRVPDVLWVAGFQVWG